MKINYTAVVLATVFLTSPLSFAQSLPGQNELCQMIEIIKKEGPNKFAHFKGREVIEDMWYRCYGLTGSTFCKLEVWTDETYKKEYRIRFGWQSSSMKRAAETASQLANMSDKCGKGAMDADTDDSYEPEDHKWILTLDGMRDDDSVMEEFRIAFYAKEQNGQNIAYMRAVYTKEIY